MDMEDPGFTLLVEKAFCTRELPLFMKSGENGDVSPVPGPERRPPGPTDGFVGEILGGGVTLKGEPEEVMDLAGGMGRCE